MQAGLYKIVLTTYFTGYSPQPTLSDYVYVNYTLPALIISLKVDGADSDIKEVWRLKDTALSSAASYDPAVETSVSLSRQWSCKKGDMTKADVVSFLGNEKLEPWPASANADCTGIITQQGRICSVQSFVLFYFFGYSSKSTFVLLIYLCTLYLLRPSLTLLLPYLL